MNHKKRKKYRPVLSAAAIAHIVALAKSEQPISTGSISLIGTLSPFLAKIENEGVAAAYTTTPSAPSLEESVGLGAERKKERKYDSTSDTAYLPKEKYWERCYDLYIIDPKNCTLSEIQAAREHMYLEGLMSKEEVSQFELETGVAASTSLADT